MQKIAESGERAGGITSSSSFTRRSFLRRGAAVGGGALAALALPGTLDRALSASPSERVVVAHIGVGGRGGSLLGQTLANASARVAAVSDVDRDRLGKARARLDAEGSAEADFRRVLDRKDIDAVVCATPDHWHAGVTIAACRAGKDVYCEKPPSYTIAEGRDMVTAARQHERVVQVGIHHRSAPYNREIARIIRGGRIGPVHTVKLFMWKNLHKPRTPFQAPPAGLDWDRWIGPAPHAAYHPDRSHYNFRWCRDFAGGYMTDWGVHMMNIITYAMDVDHKGPDFVEASGEFAPDNLYDHPMKMDARWVFRDPDFVLEWHQPEDGGDRLPGQKYGMTFYGEDGQLRTGFGNGLHKFYRDGQEAPLPREGQPVELFESPGHMQNWLDCIRTRERPVADVEIGHRTNAICLLANIALFSGRRQLHWDWKDERFVGGDRAANAAADAWLRRAPRAGFEV